MGTMTGGESKTVACPCLDKGLVERSKLLTKASVTSGATGDGELISTTFSPGSSGVISNPNGIGSPPLVAMLMGLSKGDPTYNLKRKKYIGFFKQLK